MEEEFIDLVRNYPVLYDTQLLPHKEAAARNAAWEEVAEEVNLTVQECKDSWSKLRNRYTNALKRRTNKSKALPPWVFEAQMSFLRPFVQEGREMASSSQAPPGSPEADDNVTDTIQAEQFIELVKHHDLLYNSLSPQYRDVAARNAAWDEIAAALHLPVRRCKETWSKLRNMYNNAIKRRRANKSLPPWRFEAQMSFLKPYMEGRDTGAYFVEPESPVAPEDLSDEEPLSPLHQARPDADSSTYKTNQEYDSLQDMIEILKSNQKKNEYKKQMDETDYFFLSLSQTLKRLPKVRQCRLKMEIYQCIQEAELRELQHQMRVSAAGGRAADNPSDPLFQEPENNDDDNQEAEYLDMTEEDLHDEVVIKQEPQPKKTVIYTDGVNIRKTKPRPRLVKTLKRKLVPHSSSNSHIADPTLMEIVKSLRHLKKKDECDSFGEYIANSLRKHDERTRSMIKHAINNILFEQEMKKYSASQYEISVAPEDDENPLILENNMDDN